LNRIVEALECMPRQIKTTDNQVPVTDQKPHRTFEDLEVYQVAREFRKAMYQVNRQLPSLDELSDGEIDPAASML